MTEKLCVAVVVSRRIKMVESVTINVPTSISYPDGAAKEFVQAALDAGQPLEWVVSPDKDYGAAYERGLTATSEDVPEIAAIAPAPQVSGT